jgi:IclR family transcriptional regulator, KDG regulon repressor
MTLSTKESHRFVEVVLRSLDVLDCFQDHPALSLKELIELTGLGRSRTMRLTGTLVHRGYLAFNPQTNRYRLGPRILTLGKVLERMSGLSSVIRPVLEELTDRTGESSALFSVDGFDRVVLARVNSPWSIRYSVSEGQRIPLPAGAGGKILIAFGPNALQQKLLQAGMIPLSRHEHVPGIDSFERDMAVIRENGYAVSTGERVPDSRAVAAPVFDAHNILTGALTVAGPTSRLTDDKLGEIVAAVVESSRKLSRLLGRPGYDIDQTAERNVDG